MTESKNTKHYRLRLPKALWEKFYRAFPGHGERAVVMRRLVKVAVEMAEEDPEGFLETVRAEAQRIYGGEENDS